MGLDLFFAEGRFLSVLIVDKPLRRAAGRADQQQFDIRARPAKVFDVRARQTTPTHDAVARRSWPASFDGQRAHTLTQSNSLAHHARRPTRKPVRVILFDLNCRPGAVGFTRDQNYCFHQPVRRGAAQQIVLPAQIQIIGNVAAARRAGAIFCFR